MPHNVKPFPTSRRRRDVPQRRPQPQPSQARRTVRAAPGAVGEHGQRSCPERSEGLPCDPKAQGNGSTVRSADRGGKEVRLAGCAAGA